MHNSDREKFNNRPRFQAPCIIVIDLSLRKSKTSVSEQARIIVMGRDLILVSGIDV
jgi:hypothetical protein